MLSVLLEEGQRHYTAALGVLQRHPCPTIEWKILKAGAELARLQKDGSTHTQLDCFSSGSESHAEIFSRVLPQLRDNRLGRGLRGALGSHMSNPAVYSRAVYWRGGLFGWGERAAPILRPLCFRRRHFLVLCGAPSTP